MNELLKSLNPAQLDAASERDGYILVIAGAGSGKTRVLTARVAALLEDGVPPYNILAITFTNKAAAEMKARIERETNCGGVLTATFHSFCARILRANGDCLGYDDKFSIYTEIESERTVKRILKDKGIDAKNAPKFLFHISRAKDSGLFPHEYHFEIKDFIKDAGEITSVYSAYERELKAANALDFDDLLWKTVLLFKEFPEVLKKYQTRFRYINVDEFQDTNMLQFELLKLLSAYHKNLFVVGDEDQSIYGWRGARIGNILDFPKIFPGAKVFKLEQNYRSTPEILCSANSVIVHNQKRNAKKLWTDAQSGEKVTYFEAYGDRDEADFVVRTIAKLADRGASLCGCAVLVRANSLTRTVEESLTLHGIPYKVFGGFRFFERKEIKDLLAYIRLAVNPRDNESFLRAVSVPKRGIGEASLEKLRGMFDAETSDYYSLLKKIKESELAPQFAKPLAFLNILEGLIEQVGVMQPDFFVEHAIKASGLYDALTAGAPDDQNRLENMQELIAAAAEFLKYNENATTADFLQSVALISDTDEMDGKNYVTVSTIHAVKGLEFDNVFLIGLEENLFPTRRAIDSGDIEEERRLMYVAITRAKRALYVSWARSRFRFHEVEYNPPSRFIGEMRGTADENAVLRRNIHALGQISRAADKAAKNSRFQAATAKSLDSQTEFSKEDYDAFKKDAFVEHNKYGKGLIVDATGEGEDKSLSIAFEGLGIKRFALSIAIKNLKLL